MTLTLSPKQKQVANHWYRDERLLVAVGAVRSGKTYAAACGLARFIVSEAGQYDYAIVGVTQDSAWRNVGRPLIEHLEHLQTPARDDRQYGRRIKAGAGRSIWIIGADDEKARRRIQGMTLRGLIVDEAAIIPESAWVMATSRLSVEGAKAWATLNPESPGHWFRRSVVQRLDRWRAALVDFRLTDNPTLGEQAIADLEQAYTGHMKARMIEGSWAGATGLIYSSWKVGKPPEKIARYVVGVDWAGSGVFAAVLMALTEDNEGCVIAERIYDARVQEPLTDVQQAERTAEWAASYTNEPLTAYGDPTTPAAAKQEFRRMRLWFRDADNTVLDGISRTASALSTGRLVIADECSHLKQELQEYHWDKAAQERGEDKPVKHADHAVDALRYAVMGARIGRPAVRIGIA